MTGFDPLRRLEDQTSFTPFYRSDFRVKGRIVVNNLTENNVR